MNKTLLPTKEDWITGTKRRFRFLSILVLLLTVVGSSAFAQLNYTYSLSRQTYVPITYTNTHWTGTDIDDGAINNIPLPFPFTFNDITYNVISISSNGALYFGPTGNSNISGTISNAGLNNLVCANCQDLRAGSTGTAGSTTIGTAPNRVFVVEFTNWRRFGVDPVGSPHDFNFQFRLSEATNIVEVAYGPHSFTNNTSSFTAQVGLKGGTQNEFITLTGTGDSAWVQATTGPDIATSIPFSQTILPRNGLRYTFTPIPPAANDLAVQRFINLPTATNLCDSAVVSNLGVIIRNRGTNGIANVSLSLSVFQGSTLVSSEVVIGSALPQNTTDTLFFSNVLLPARGNYRFVVASNNQDNIVANDTIRGNVNIARNCFDVPYTFRESGGTYTPLQNPTLVRTTFQGEQILITPPFPIVFNRRQYNQLTINDNGQILFGNRINEFPTNINPIAALNNVIAPLGFDQQSRSAAAFPFNSIKTEVTGSPGSRIFIIQYDSMSRVFPAAADLDYYNYQVKFDEATREITFAYGTFETSATETFPLRPQVGMRINDSVFHHRAIVLANNNWRDNSRSLDNTASMILNSRLKPDVGTEYIWTPTAAPSFDIAMIGAELSQTGTNLCDSIEVFGGFAYTNAGFSPLTNAQFVVTVRRNGVVEFRDTVSSTRTLNEFENDTVFFGPYNANQVGVYFYSITPLLTDGDASNNLATATFSIGRDCRDIPFDFSENPAVFELLTNGTPVALPGTGLADNTNNTVNLPFPVFFNGTLFNQVTINTNGYMVFGPNNPNFQEAGVLAVAQNVVAAFNLDAALDSGTFLTTGVQGPANDPTFVIQWRNIEPWGTRMTDDIRMTAQIRINRNTQTISIAYGENTYTSTTTPQTIATVGIAFNTNTFHARTMLLTGGNWSNSFRAANNNGAMLFSAAITPANGQGFIFTPRALPQANVAARTITGPRAVVCVNNSAGVNLVYSNNAFNQVSSVPVRLRVTRPNGTPLPDVTATTTNSLAIGGVDTVFLSTINFTDTGVYRITAITELPGDESRTNDTVRSTVRVNPEVVYNLTSQACIGARSVLKIAGSQGVRFFSDAGRTQLLASDSLVIPSVPSAATTYFVSTTESNTIVRAPYNFGTTGGQVNFGPTGYGLIITLNSPTGIASAEVNPGGAGEFGWEVVLPNTTTPLHSGTITVAAGGVQRVFFNIPTLQPGVYWFRLTTQTTTLYRDNPAQGLPYNIPNGIGTVTGLLANGLSNTAYYFFYNIDFGSTTCGGTGTFAINPVAPPAAPAITLGGLASICTGQTSTVEGPAPTPGLTYLWSTGATTRIITVSAPGTFTLRMVNAQGCTSAVSNAIEITANPGPAAPVITNATGTSTICPGDRIVLRLPSGGSYIWSNNSTADSLVVTGVGTFTARAITGGCTSLVSAPVAITAATQTAVTSIVNVNNVSTICPGDTVILEAANANATIYQWSNGATTRRISVTTPGSYTVRVRQQGQCLSPISVASVVAPGSPPAVGFTASVINNGRRVALENLTANANNAVYRFDNRTLNTVEGRRDTIEFAADGSYDIRLVASNGCGADSSTQTITITNANNVALAKFISAYPNPTTSDVNVNFGSLSFNKAVIQVLDVTGREVSNSIVNAASVLKMANLKAAMYTLKITVDNEAPVFIPIVKQ